MEEEFYKKVYIKSESDLPKEESQYYCFKEGNCYLLNRITMLNNFKNIDWYFLPIEPPEITDEEINEQFPVKSEYRVLTLDYINTNNNKREGAKWLRNKLTT